MLDRLGLDWPDLFEEVSYVPPAKSAERLVLDAITQGERWTITTHDFGDDLDLALAVEIAEHLLPARHRVRDRLRFRAGRKIAWEHFPLTVAFVIAVARKLGTSVGEHRSARLIHLLTEYGLIEQVKWENIRREEESRRFRIFRLAPATRASWDEKLASAEAAASTSSQPSTTHHPATTLFLVAGDELSSPSTAVEGAFGRALRACAGHDRAPPANGTRP